MRDDAETPERYFRPSIVGFGSVVIELAPSRGPNTHGIRAGKQIQRSSISIFHVIVSCILDHGFLVKQTLKRKPRAQAPKPLQGSESR